MTLNELNTLEDITIVHPNSNDLAIQGLYIGDLLSVVMAKSKEGQLWLTVQTHLNVLAVASLKDLVGIVFVDGQEPEEETIKKAEELDMPLYKTNLSAYELTKKLVQLGL